MAYEKSAGAIIFRMKEEPKGVEPFYLLLRYPGGYWEFARGHIEEGEREHATASREIREETGLVGLKFSRGFREKYRFHFKRSGKAITKDAVIFLAEATSWRVKVSEEHYGYVWASYREAMGHLQYDNSKNVLRKAHAFLKRRTPSRGQKPRFEQRPEQS